MAGMTRKHLQDIADQIAHEARDAEDAERIARILAPALKRGCGLNANGNSRFDQVRFINAATKVGS